MAVQRYCVLIKRDAKKALEKIPEKIRCLIEKKSNGFRSIQSGNPRVAQW